MPRSAVVNANSKIRLYSLKNIEQGPLQMYSVSLRCGNRSPVQASDCVTALNWCSPAAVAFRVSPCLALYSTSCTRSVLSFAVTPIPNVIPDEIPCRKI